MRCGEGEFLLQMRLCNHYQRACILLHELNAVRGKCRIERKISSACFEGSQQGCDHLHAAIHADANQSSRLNPKVLQSRSELTRRLAKGTIRHSLFQKGDRDIVWPFLRRQLE